MANGVWPWAAALLVVAAAQDSTTTTTFPSVTVTADGSQSRPMCAYMSQCAWNTTTQQLCAQKLCQSSGFLGGTFVSAYNNLCTSSVGSFVDQWVYVVDWQSLYYGGVTSRAQITASCNNAQSATTSTPSPVTTTTTSTSSRTSTTSTVALTTTTSRSATSSSSAVASSTTTGSVSTASSTTSRPMNRTAVMICGLISFDLRTAMLSVTYSIVVGCNPNNDTQAFFLTRYGYPFDWNSLRLYLSRGGIVITEFSSGIAVYNNVWMTNTASSGNLYGGCQDTLPEIVTFNTNNSFWLTLGFTSQSYSMTGCGYPITAATYPGVIPLAGWDSSSVSLAVASYGLGTVWFANWDWQDGTAPPEYLPRLKQVLNYMMNNLAGVGTPLTAPPTTTTITTTSTTTSAGSGPWYSVVSGPCTARGDCVTSSNYPGYYSNMESCVINVLQSIPIYSTSFSTESCCDTLMINGVRYAGYTTIQGIVPYGQITWSSDSSVTATGWSLCPMTSSGPSPVPSPAYYPAPSPVYYPAPSPVYYPPSPVYYPAPSPSYTPPSPAPVYYPPSPIYWPTPTPTPSPSPGMPTTTTTTWTASWSPYGTTTTYPGGGVIVVSDGTQSRPYCSWYGGCSWNSYSQQICAQKLCEASGFLIGTFLYGNDMCSTSITDGWAWYFVYGWGSYSYNNLGMEAQITASCSNTPFATTTPPYSAPTPSWAPTPSYAPMPTPSPTYYPPSPFYWPTPTETSSTSTTTSTVSSTTSRTVSVTSSTRTSTTTTSTTVTCAPGTAWSDAAGCVPCPSGYTSDATTAGCVPLLATVLRALRDPSLNATSDNLGTTWWNVTADRLPPLVYPSTVLEYAADVALTSAALAPASACAVRWQPVPSGGLLLVEPYNGSCASKLNTTTVAGNVERRGFVGIFLLVSSPDLGTRQRVGSWVIPVTLRLARATAASYDGIAVWSSTALPAQTFALTSLSSALQVFNSTLFAKKVLTPFYKDGDTVYVEHGLDANGAPLNVTIIQLWLSTFADGRDVAVNLTSSVAKLSSPYGAARVSFVAKACRYCYLQSLAQIAAPTPPGGRRLAAGDRRLAEERFCYANLNVDIGGSEDSTGVRVVVTNTRQGDVVASENTTGKAAAERTAIMTAKAWMARTAGGALLLAFLSTCLAASA